MLIELDSNNYGTHFQNKVNPFLDLNFIALNERKVERVVRLVKDNEKATIGLIGGIRNKQLISPFSAPFGGFDYKKENVYILEIEDFIKELINYVKNEGLESIKITFPPAIYENTFNSKMINVLGRFGFTSSIPELTNWIDLKIFEHRFTQKNTREFYNQSLRNNLSFKKIESDGEREQIYNLVKNNRERFGRSIYMTFEDIKKICLLWPVDFFGVFSDSHELIAGAIFYQFSNKIAFALFWGDSEVGRPLRAMDFLSFQLWSVYKEKGFTYIDLGVSTENNSQPNEGLLRFKESHEGITGLKNTLNWKLS